MGLSPEGRMAAGLVVYATPLGVAFVPGAVVVLPVLIAVACFGLWVFAHEVLRGRRSDMGKKKPPKGPKPGPGGDVIIGSQHQKGGETNLTVNKYYGPLQRSFKGLSASALDT